MAKDLIDIFLDMTLQPILDAIFTDEFKGKHGEKLTEKELKKVSFFGRKGKTLRNVYIPKENGETSEIDVMFICQKGIFVFESKNYSGWIFGNEKDQYWTASLASGTKNRFYNPIKQNRTHIKWLKEYINTDNLDVPVFSIIVFSERCELKKITTYSSDIAVIKRDKTYKTVRNIWDNAPDYLSENQVDDIFNRLEVLTNVDESVKLAHIKDIEEKYKKDMSSESVTQNSNTVVSDAEDSLICPKCGSKLMLRTAKKGPNAGNQFYGCSGYPGCKYIKNLQ